MQHIPEVADPIYPPLQIPYVVDGGRGYRYDYLGFSGYPERCGWSIQEVFYPNSTRNRQDRLAFLQSWLFFALLADVLNLGPEDLEHGLEHEFCTIEPSGSCFITTERLSVHLERQSYIFGALGARGFLSYYFRQKHSYLERANFFLRRPRIGPERERDDLTDLIEFSVALLGDFLSYYLSNAWIRRGGIPWNGNPNPFSSIGWWGQSGLIRRRFEEQHWCPLDISFAMASPSKGYYASRLRYPNPGAHIDCTDTLCRASQVSSSYATTHTDSCSQEMCDLVHVNIDNVKVFIAAGVVPVLKVGSNNDLSSGPQISVETAESGNYVAISHVWSHGLGNPTDNALFRCQLMNVQRLVRNRYFWLDTLCIPVKSADIFYRKMAISGMRGVYSAAEEVLVLDRCLQATSSALPELELLLRVEISGWMKRLWTLQEAVLARRLVIQFSDGTVPLANLTRARTAGSWRTANPVSPLTGLGCATFSLIGNATGVEKLCHVSTVVRQRSTTKEEDEPVCLATLLDIDLAPILEEAGARRMVQFWSACEIIPRNVFIGSRARLEDDGFHWAPKTLMGFSTGLHEEFGTCVRQDGGVHVTCPIWHVERLDLGLGMTLVKEIGSEQVLLLGLDGSILENAERVHEGIEEMRVYEEICICGVMEGHHVVPTTWTGSARWLINGFLGSRSISNLGQVPKMRYIQPIWYITLSPGTDLSRWRRLGAPTPMSRFMGRSQSSIIVI